MSKFTKQIKYSEKVLSKINNSAIIQLQKQKRKNKDTKDKIFEKQERKGGTVHWDLRKLFSI